MDYRFGVSRADGYTSSVWRLWVVSRGDAYLAVRNFAGISKYSFHPENNCRNAYTSQYSKKRTMKDRLVSEWYRADTPMHGSGKWSQPFFLFVPTDYLSKPIDHGKKTIDWIEAAPPGKAILLTLGMTRDQRGVVEHAINQSVPELSHRLLAFAPMFTDENLMLTSHCVDSGMGDFSSPHANESIMPDLLISKEDPYQTGRPYRMCISNVDESRNAIIVREVGGCVDPKPLKEYKVTVTNSADLIRKKFTRAPIAQHLSELKPQEPGSEDPYLKALFRDLKRD
jgi:hypothetical protein